MEIDRHMDLVSDLFTNPPQAADGEPEPPEDRSAIQKLIHDDSPSNEPLGDASFKAENEAFAEARI